MSNTIMQNVIAAVTRKFAPADAARTAAFPHVVDQPGLTRNLIGDAAYERGRRTREGWMNAHGLGKHIIEPLRNSAGELVGRRYRFSDADDASRFGRRF